jgi:hypothetical protein
VVAQRGPDLLDAEVQALVEVDVGVAAPDLLAQLFARDQLARARGQQRQHLERLLLDLDRQAALAQLARAQVKLELTEAEHALVSGGARCGECPAVHDDGCPPAGTARLSRNDAARAGEVLKTFRKRMCSRRAGTIGAAGLNSTFRCHEP